MLSLGVASPQITPVQLENQLCLLRFSACTYPQQGNFHEEHCKGTWLAGQVFVVLMPTHITPVKEQRKKKHVLSVLHLCVTVVACFMSLCALWSLCVIVYTLVLFHRFIFFYLIQNYLFAMYMLIYDRAVSFHLLLPSV